MQAVGLQTYIWNNNLRSVFLLAGFPFLLFLLLYAVILIVVGNTGMHQAYSDYSAAAPPNLFAYTLQLTVQSLPLAIAVAVIWFVIAYFANQTIIDLATGARPIERSENEELYNLLENLCISRGMKTPTLRIIESEDLNAFATGLHEGQFSVTVTRGLLERLDRDELEAVLGHELTHIINRDVRTMIVAAVFAGIISLVAQVIARMMLYGGRGRGRGGGLLIIVGIAAAALAWLLAIVIRMAISRRREFVADAGSVELTKNPDAMISALQKVAGHAHLDAPEEVRGLFLENREEGIWGLFATHPPIEKRIAALTQYAGGHVREQPQAPAPAATQPYESVPSPDEKPGGPWGAPSDGPWGDRPTGGPWN
ncbi:MAG TPA: M48 family metallopeptidase [Caulobacteraceae bacterium]|nr:M48 family metallopeptidase [Caulobacteraceae bacterium]